MSGYPAAIGRIVGITLAAGAVMILAAGGCAASSRLKAVTGEVEF